MDHNGNDRTIAALTAIVRTMLAEQYGRSSETGTRAFDQALKNDDPLALAISNVLSRDEIAHAFAPVDTVTGTPDDDLAADPIVTYPTRRRSSGYRQGMLKLSAKAGMGHRPD